MNTDIRRALKNFIDQSSVYNQAALAKKAGLTPSQLSAVLNKKRKLSADEFFSLCMALGVTPNDLFAASTQKSA